MHFLQHNQLLQSEIFITRVGILFCLTKKERTKFLPEENHQTLSGNQKRIKRNFYDQPNAGQLFVQPVPQLGHHLMLLVFRLYIVDEKNGIESLAKCFIDVE